MSHVELHHGAATDVGLVRTANEDAFLTAPPVFVVADGMGGHDAGDVASAMVVDEFSALADDDLADASAELVAQRVAHALRGVQARIARFDADHHAAGDAGFSAGTTAAVAVLVHTDGASHWLLANVGDSRIYRYDAGALEQISVDHSVVQELIDAGRITPAEAEAHPSRHVVTRALGASVSGEADYFLLPLPSVERLLLCSDGVSGMIDDGEIATILGRTEDPRDAADQLVAAALRAGGRDNATAVVVDVVGLAHDLTYDSDAQRLSLEQKLGALP